MRRAAALDPLRLLRPRGRQWGWLALALTLAVITLAAGMGLLALSGWFITASALAGLGGYALDIFTPGAGIRALAVTRTVARYGERVVAHEATFRQLAILRVRLFERLLRQDPGQLHRLGRGAALDRFSSDIDTLDRLFLQWISPTLATGTLTLLAAGLAALASPVLAIPLGALWGIGTLLLILGTRLARRPGHRLAEAAPRLRGRLAETLAGRTELRLLGRIGTARESLRAAAAEHLAAGMRLHRLGAAGRALLQFAGWTAAWAVLVIGLGLHAQGLLDGPSLVMAALAALAAADAWPPLAAGWTWLETCRRAAARVGEITGAETADEPGERRPDTSSPLSLALDDVDFGYSGGGPIIAGANLEVAPGDHIVITGASGGGKTTLARLMAGLVAPDRGRVRLDDRAQADYDPDGWRAHIGYLDQRPMLFTDTLAANLRLGAPAAGDETLLRVLKSVVLDDFLAGLPEGLATWIGEAGHNVSGGQARRLALARLVLGDFPVMILDEPTAGIDADTTEHMLANLAGDWHDRSVVVFTHDPRPWTEYRRLHLDRGRLWAD